MTAAELARGAAWDDVLRGGRLQTDGGVPISGVHTKPPNPWGSKGGPAHRALAREIEDDIESRGLISWRESPIRNSAGDIVQRVDVVGLRSAVPVEFHQVGLVTRAGHPVAREWEAFLDIYDLTGIWPEFHPYGILG